MKKKFLLIIIINSFLLSQQEIVEVDHPIYSFLERMSALKIVSEYDHFEKPTTRLKVADHLNQILTNQSSLTPIDKKIFDDFFREFEFDLEKKLENSHSLISDSDYSLFSEKEKYFYNYDDESKNSVFINLVSGLSTAYDNVLRESATTVTWGGIIRGSVMDFFSFQLQATNGYADGSKSVAKIFHPKLRHNFKFNSYPPSNNFDDASGSFSFARSNFTFKIGNDDHIIGYGMMNPLLQNNSPRIPSIHTKFRIGFFNFSYLHGKLLGEESASYDSAQGVLKNVKEKYFAYHRFGFDVSKDFTFGVGEIVIYGNRSADLANLIPFNFYKSAEHANRDRDNSMLFLDFNNKQLDNIFAFGTLLIDDVDFGKLGTDWWGNQFLYHVGIHSYNFYKSIPLIVKGEYLRISPFVFTHRIPNNNFTNQSYPVGIELQPNSENYNLGLEYYFNYRLKSELNYTYSEHGANPLDAFGKIDRNVGGNINFGHREFDSKETKFLDGDLEIIRQLRLIIIYEPINNIFLNFILKNETETKQGSASSNYQFYTSLKLLL